ncbi:MAG: transporter substrate-binding domain-containing protein, partial [Geodermatophilaceae bacterium]|nr:transporter substrate-binding domain-containing protein [Geodermatophilaceae bacterium]
GEVVAVTTDNVILTAFVATDPESFELVGAPFTEEPYGIGLALEDEEFRDFVNDVLEEAYESGAWADAYAATVGDITGTEAPEPPAVDRYTA